MDTKVLERLEEIFAEDLAELGHDLAGLEQGITTLLRQVGQVLLQRQVERRANGYEGSSLACACGGSLRFVAHRARQIHTTWGWIQVPRAYYHCPTCGARRVPYDEASGLGPAALSSGLAQACSLLAVDDSFQQASRKLAALLGQQVSDTTIARVVHQVGQVALAQQDQQLTQARQRHQPPGAEITPARLYVAPDGTTVHERDAWHESKVGCVYGETAAGERFCRYVSRMDPAAIFGGHLWHRACRLGLREAREIVYLGDGAGWIRTLQEEYFSRATFIIDWYHACEHLWECGQALYGEGTPATARWVQVRRNWLWEGETKKLLDDLQRQRHRYRGVRQRALDSLHHYVRVNEEQMRYDVFRAKGYDIGSGAVEGACKHVVGKRLKQTGMIWSRPGSSAVLALRLVWLNEEWSQLWSQKPLAA